MYKGANKREYSHSGLNLLAIYRKPKRSQVTIFIIIAIVIVAGLLVYFLAIRPNFQQASGGKLKMESCLQDAVKNNANALGLTAGIANPTFTYSDKGVKIPYLCYTSEYYKPCINQVPFLVENFQSEMVKKISSQVKACYDSSVSDLKARGFDVVSGDVSFDVSLIPEQMILNVHAPTTVTKTSTSRFTDVQLKFASAYYEMLMIATSIIQNEINYGNIDTIYYMNLFPDYIITVDKKEDGTKIYSIQHRELKTKFVFAVRNVVFPPGYSLGA